MNLPLERKFESDEFYDYMHKTVEALHCKIGARPMTKEDKKRLKEVLL